MKETYREMRERHRKEYNDFPIGAAFSKEQLAEEKRKLGVKDDSELLGIGFGCFIRKRDRRAYRTMTRRMRREMDKAMLNEEFATGAFEYEAANHEYHINPDPQFDLAGCFGYPTRNDGGYIVIAWDRIPNGEFLHRCFVNGIRRFMKTANY